MLLSRVNTNYKILLLSSPLLVLAFFQEWLDYFSLWSTSYIYTNGFLVFLGTVYLLFHRKDAFKQLPPSFSWTYLTIFIGLTILFLLAHSGNVKIVRLVLLPFLLIAWGAALWGTAFIKLVGVPILLVLFAAPFWDEMSPALQWLTVAVDEYMLALISIPATIEEYYITIPSGIFHVDDGCSGVRYLIVALYLGAFYGTLTHSSAKRTLLLISIAGFLALLANWIRVAGIIAAGHYTNMESSLVEDHEMFGWIVFIAITLIPFLALTHFLEKSPTKEQNQQFPPSPKVQVVSEAKSAILSATLPLIAIPTMLLLQSALAENNAQAWKPMLPKGNTEVWKGPIRHANFWNPQHKANDVHLSGVYVSEKHEQVQLDFYGYNRQYQGKELIYYQNSVFDRELWQPVQKDVKQIQAPEPWELTEVNQLILRHKSKDETAVVWFWYDVAGQLLTSSSEVQLIGGIKTFLGDQRAAIWILSTECKHSVLPQCESKTEKRFESFFQNTSPLRNQRNQ